MRDNCKNCRKLVRILIVINILLIMSNLLITLKLNLFQEKGERFTYQDGVLLYRIMNNEIVEIKDNENTTDFQKYLLKQNYEEN